MSTLSSKLDRIEANLNSIRTVSGLEGKIIEDLPSGLETKFNDYDNALTARDNQIDELNTTVANKDSEIEGLNNTVSEKEQIIAEKEVHISELGNALAESTTNYESAVTTIESLNTEIEEKTVALNKANERVDELTSLETELNKTIMMNIQVMEEQRATIENRNAVIQEKNTIIAEKEAEIVILNERIAELEGGDVVTKYLTHIKFKHSALDEIITEGDIQIGLSKNGEFLGSWSGSTEYTLELEPGTYYVSVNDALDLEGNKLPFSIPGGGEFTVEESECEAIITLWHEAPTEPEVPTEPEIPTEPVRKAVLNLFDSGYDYAPTDPVPLDSKYTATVRLLNTPTAGIIDPSQYLLEVTGTSPLEFDLTNIADGTYLFFLWSVTSEDSSSDNPVFCVGDHIEFTVVDGQAEANYYVPRNDNRGDLVIGFTDSQETFSEDYEHRFNIYSGDTLIEEVTSPDAYYSTKLVPGTYEIELISSTPKTNTNAPTVTYLDSSRRIVDVPEFELTEIRIIYEPSTDEPSTDEEITEFRLTSQRVNDGETIPAGSIVGLPSLPEGIFEPMLFMELERDEVLIGIDGANQERAFLRRMQNDFDSKTFGYKSSDEYFKWYFPATDKYESGNWEGALYGITSNDDTLRDIDVSIHNTGRDVEGDVFFKVTNDITIRYAYGLERISDRFGLYYAEGPEKEEA